MKIFPISDTHLELHKDGGKSFAKSLDPEGVDVLIAAGDIISLLDPSPLYRLCDRFKDARVLYVYGNHEFWKQSVDEALESLSKISYPNLTILNNSTVEIGGRKFHGSPLWFCESDVLRTGLIDAHFADFMTISGFKPWVYREHEKCSKWLRDTVRDGDVVITHHLPSYKCVSPRWQNSLDNCFFASYQDETIWLCEPSVWIHGHGHDSIDTMLHKTRMIRNPFGYIRALNQDFDQNFRIEL